MFWSSEGTIKKRERQGASTMIEIIKIFWNNSSQMRKVARIYPSSIQIQKNKKSQLISYSRATDQGDTEIYS